jgi:hypothetical protein
VEGQARSDWGKKRGVGSMATVTPFKLHGGAVWRGVGGHLGVVPRGERSEEGGPVQCLVVAAGRQRPRADGCGRHDCSKYGREMRH